MKKLETTPYKGVRDFYPKEMHLEKYLFSSMRTVAERFGYVEYGASPLEPAELYKAKSGEEIVNEQTYTFIDRGDREVTLRPEMTPTVARMVAGQRRELGFPLRWYSIPNLFRYENPQRGRLREHYQLNVDVFGIPGLEAESEIISLASGIMKEFGATDSDFAILVNSRKMLNDFFAKFDISDADRHTISKLIDKKNKLEKTAFKESLQKILSDKVDSFIESLESADAMVALLGQDNENIQNLITLMEMLKSNGLTNVVFSPTLMRGFDYYTDIVFEIFDTNPENKRSLFGGGRYDNLTSLFNDDETPAVGFGMGDVTLVDFLQSHNLVPAYTSEVHVNVASVSESDGASTLALAHLLRSQGINVATDTSKRSVGDKIKATLKLAIPYFIAVGENEVTSKIYKLKNLTTSEEKEISESEIASTLLSR